MKGLPLWMILNKLSLTICFKRSAPLSCEVILWRWGWPHLGSHPSLMCVEPPPTIPTLSDQGIEFVKMFILGSYLLFSSILLLLFPCYIGTLNRFMTEKKKKKKKGGVWEEGGNHSIFLPMKFQPIWIFSQIKKNSEKKFAKIPKSSQKKLSHFYTWFK
jgi:hypothetical protein